MKIYIYITNISGLNDLIQSDEKKRNIGIVKLATNFIQKFLFENIFTFMLLLLIKKKRLRQILETSLLQMLESPLLGSL